MLGRKVTDSLSWSELISCLDRFCSPKGTSLFLKIDRFDPYFMCYSLWLPCFLQCSFSAEVGFGTQDWPITVAYKQVSGFLAWVIIAPCLGTITGASCSGMVRRGQVNGTLQFCISPKPVPVTNTHHLWNFSNIDFTTSWVSFLICFHFLNILTFFTVKAKLSDSLVQPESYLYIQILFQTF